MAAARRCASACTPALACSLLSRPEKSRLALRVQQLTESRAETVDTQAAELRRIERDLHDGAQARLVALGMSLGLAEEQLARDPDGARALLAEARGTASDALAELRDLVRGIHPPVLADRGLVGAVQALALAVADPGRGARRHSPGRLPAPVESAAYFAVAEGSPMSIKHSGATRARSGSNTAWAGCISRSTTTGSAGPTRRTAPGCAASSAGCRPSTAR